MSALEKLRAGQTKVGARDAAAGIEQTSLELLDVTPRAADQDPRRARAGCTRAALDAGASAASSASSPSPATAPR